MPKIVLKTGEVVDVADEQRGYRIDQQRGRVGVARKDGYKSADAARKTAKRMMSSLSKLTS